MPTSIDVDVLRLGLGLFFLGLASFTDVRTRKVPNRIWFAMLAVGVALMIMDFIISGSDQVLLLTPIPVIIIFLVIFTEGELIPERVSDKVNLGLTLILLLVAIIVLWYQGDVLGFDDRWIRVLHIPIILVLAYLFYGLRILHGGADAKALMGLAVLTPFYPVLDGFPLIRNPEAMTMVLPFTFVILVNSAIVTLFVPLGFAILNMTRGDHGGRMFFGYRLPLKDVPKSHVWLMEKVRDGEVVTFLFPKRGVGKELKKELRALKKAGLKKVWVNPKIPFMVPMFFGFLISFFIGNLIFGLIERLMGA